jgi:hypothetical protein
VSSPWKVQLHDSTIDLLQVYGTAAGEVYAVGSRGLVRYSTGDGVWHGQAAGSEDLIGVWADPLGSNIYAVGGQGSILHSTGNGVWITEVSTGSPLNFVWGASADDVYAVGDGGAVWHKGAVGGWQKQVSSTTLPLTSVWGPSASDLYLVGLGVTLHSTGDGTWTRLASPTASLTMISGFGSSSLSVGLGGVGFRGDGITFVAQSFGVASNLWGVAVRATDALVVGEGGTVLRSAGGGAWSLEVLPPAVAGAGWTGAWGNDAVGVYVVAHEGVIMHRP